jgi:hypothetical protein
MSKYPINLDERNINILLRICTVLYIITLYSLIVIQLYRQFVLHQATSEWQDIANILTFNVLVLLGSALYLGGLTPQKVKIRTILFLYLGFVFIGVSFTIFKYTILLKEQINWGDIGSYFLIVSVICAVLIMAWSILAYLGQKRIEKKLE